MWSILKLLIASDSGQNVRLINDILEQAELQSVSGILLELDFRKAFDTIEWRVIQQTLSRSNFVEGIKRWVQTVYCNAESCILNMALIRDKYPWQEVFDKAILCRQISLFWCPRY